jgi:hypothetical protein
VLDQISLVERILSLLPSFILQKYPVQRLTLLRRQEGTCVLAYVELAIQKPVVAVSASQAAFYN